MAHYLQLDRQYDKKISIEYIMLSEVFWIAFLSTACGLIIKLASMAFKSKCSDCSFCGITVHRDVVLEEKETEFLTLNKTKSLREPPSP